MATDLLKCLVHSICLLRKKLQHLAGCCCYDLYICNGGGGGRGGGVSVCTCDQSGRSPRVCVGGVLVHAGDWVRGCLWFSVCQFHFAFIPCFCLIKWQSPLSLQTCTINFICVGTCTGNLWTCVRLHIHPNLHTYMLCVWCVCVHACMCVCMHACRQLWVRGCCVSVCISFTLLCLRSNWFLCIYAFQKCSYFPASCSCLMHTCSFVLTTMIYCSN